MNAFLPSERRARLVLLALLAVSVLPEAILLGADWGIWGSPRWRRFTYEHFAFWTGLLRGWTPNYPLQPWLMFVTYAGLHAGPGHLLVNMVTLVSVARAELDRVGAWRFATIYALSVLGGAAGFALLSDKLQPMVGASGALFGLVGAWVIWDISDTLRARPGIATLAYAILWPIILLSVLNVLMFWVTSGHLAWETHLGGFIAGALAAPFLDRRPRDG
jgi:membrane associated rhomboid family serine protease